MGYWKTKVLPKIKKVFEKNGSKKAAAEACKAFDDSKEAINTEFEEKKIELQVKVVEIYQASSTEIKTLVADRKEEDVKKNSATIHLFLQELAKIEFPGVKQVCDASEKFGAGSVPGPILFIFEKVSTFIVVADKKGPETSEPEPAPVVETTEEASGKEKEVVVELEKKPKEKEVEEIKALVVEEEKNTEASKP